MEQLKPVVGLQQPLSVCPKAITRRMAVEQQPRLLLAIIWFMGAMAAYPGVSDGSRVAPGLPILVAGSWTTESCCSVWAAEFRFTERAVA